MTDGSALAKYEEWIRAQGGDPDLGPLPVAPVVVPVSATESGICARAASPRGAFTALDLGAGRHRAGDPVDHAVGSSLKKRGDAVDGEPLAEIHARGRVGRRGGTAGAPSPRRMSSATPRLSRARSSSTSFAEGFAPRGVLSRHTVRCTIGSVAALSFDTNHTGSVDNEGGGIAAPPWVGVGAVGAPARPTVRAA